MNIEVTSEEFELLLAGLGALVHDRRFSTNRQWDAQQLSQKLWFATDGDK